jgi:5-methylcytosine-specific restriction endonuclease McrA
MSDSKYGVCSQTRECRAEQVKRAYKANPGKFRKRSILYRQNNAQAVYEANRRWRAANPDKVREMKSRERERNAVRHRERKKRYYQNNRDKIRDRQRAWYAANPEARRRAVERVRQWNEENPERARLNSRRQVRKRRTLRESLPFIPFDESALLDQYGYCCYLCSKPLDLTDIHWDHAVPLSKGGWTVPENMRPTHPACNMSKSDKLEWNHETYSTIYAMLSAGGWEGYAVTLKHGEFRTEPVTHATLADAA